MAQSVEGNPFASTGGERGRGQVPAVEVTNEQARAKDLVATMPGMKENSNRAETLIRPARGGDRLA